MSITFDNIPTNSIRVPGVYIETPAGPGSADGAHRRQLFIGQRLSSGTVVANEPKLVTFPDQADEYFGAGSMLARMLKTAYKSNAITETWAIAVDDAAAGVVATGSFAFSGTVTKTSTLSLYIGGVKVSIAVVTDDTATAVAAAVAAAINAETECPVTATADTGTVTVTAKHKGLLGNQIDLRHSYYTTDKLPAGLSLTITAMASGDGNPDISDALAAVEGMWFRWFCMPYTDTANLAALRDEIESRWDWDIQKRAVGISATPGTVGEMQALGDTLNSPYLSVMGAGKSPSTPETVAATYCATAARHLNENPARPLQTLVMKGMLPPSRQDELSKTEQNTLLFSGIATYTVSSDGECQIQRAITTYQENAWGAPDTAYLDLNRPATIADSAEDLHDHLTSVFPRHMLAKDGSGTANQEAAKIATPSLVDSVVYDRLLYQHLEKHWIQHPETIKDRMIFNIPEDNPSAVHAYVPIEPMNQLRQICMRLEHS